MIDDPDTEPVEPDFETEDDAPDWSNEIPSDELLAGNLKDQLEGHRSHLLGQKHEDEQAQKALLEDLQEHYFGV